MDFWNQPTVYSKYSAERTEQNDYDLSYNTLIKDHSGLLQLEFYFCSREHHFFSLLLDWTHQSNY